MYTVHVACTCKCTNMFIHEYGRRNVLSNLNCWFLSLRYSKGRLVCFAKKTFMLKVNSVNAGPNRIKSVSAECVRLADSTQEGSGNESFLR